MQIRSAIRSQHQVDWEEFSLFAHDNSCINFQYEFINKFFTSLSKYNKRNPLFYCCSRIRFQIPVFELCKIWIKKLNNYSTTEWFSAKLHKVKHRKSWKLLNWDQLQSDFPSLWMGISSWEVHNIIGKGQTNLPTCEKLKLSQPFTQTPGRT